MTFFDLILIIILFFFVASGIRFGLIVTFGSLLGTVIGVLVAGNYFEQLANVMKGLFLGNINLAKVVAFIILFVVVSRLVGFIFWIINKFFKVFTALPFLSSINRLAGGLLGFFEGAVILGVILVIVAKFPFASFILPAIEASKVAQWLIGYGKILVPFLPEAIRAINTNIKIPGLNL